MADQLNLHQRINAVRRGNDYIKKDKRVGEGGYMAITHDAVTAALRADLVANGVLIFPSVVPGTSRVVPTGTFTAKKVPFIRYEAEIAVAFINADDPKDREIAVIPAHAIDQGDKAPGKALSYAVKGAMLKVFSVETGEDDEGRQQEETGGLSEDQYNGWSAKIQALAKTGAPAEQLWTNISTACKDADDSASLLKLKAQITSRLKEIKAAQKSSSERAH